MAQILRINFRDIAAILHCYREMWRTVPPLSRGSVPIFREMYEMSQVCLVYYSWNWWYIIECSFCNATSLEYPSDTWCWLGSSFVIPSSFVHINWILQSFKNIFWKFVRHDGWCSSLSILLQQQTLWQIQFWWSGESRSINSTFNTNQRAKLWEICLQ